MSKCYIHLAHSCFRLGSSILIYGIDHRGRGSVIGSLVIAGVLVGHNEIGRLRNLSAKDSKLLPPTRRSKLAPEIVKIVRSHYVVRLSPAEINMVVETGQVCPRPDEKSDKSLRY